MNVFNFFVIKKEKSLKPIGLEAKEPGKVLFVTQYRLGYKTASIHKVFDISMFQSAELYIYLQEVYVILIFDII